jgi:hypothetical protein
MLYPFLQQSHLTAWMVVCSSKMDKLYEKYEGMAILGRKDQLRLQLHLASVSKIITATAF